MSAYAEQRSGWTQPFDGPRPTPSTWVRNRTEAELRELSDDPNWPAVPATIDQAELLTVAKLILQRHGEGRRYLPKTAMSKIVEVWLTDGLVVIWPADHGKAYHHFGDYAVAWAMKFLRPNDDAIPLT